MAYLDHFRTDSFVYWALPERDYNGNDIFSLPIEFRGQLKDVRKEYILEDGNSTVSTAPVLSDHPDVKEGGFLFVGRLADLTEAEITNPKTRKDVFTIRTINEVKILDTLEKVKIIWM